jgi:hypothetical protein
MNILAQCPVKNNRIQNVSKKCEMNLLIKTREKCFYIKAYDLKENDTLIVYCLRRVGNNIIY